MQGEAADVATNGEWKWGAWGFFPALSHREAFACILNCGSLCWPCLELSGWHGKLVAAPQPRRLLARQGLRRRDPGNRQQLPRSQLNRSTARVQGLLQFLPEYLSLFHVSCLCMDGLLYLTLFASCSVMAVCLTCWCLFLFCSSFMRATPYPASCLLPR